MEERDKINIETEFMRNIVSGALRKYLRKNYNYNIDISINRLSVENRDGKTFVHIDTDIGIDKRLLKEIRQNNGLIAGGIAGALFKVLHLC